MNTQHDITQMLPDMAAHRNDRFLLDYFCLKKCAHRWAQLTENEAVLLENTVDGFPKQYYYSYCSDNNEKMREYHVDTHIHRFLDATDKFARNLPLRINGRQPVLLAFSKKTERVQMVPIFSS